MFDCRKHVRPEAKPSVGQIRSDHLGASGSQVLIFKTARPCNPRDSAQTQVRACIQAAATGSKLTSSQVAGPRHWERWDERRVDSVIGLGTALGCRAYGQLNALTVSISPQVCPRDTCTGQKRLASQSHVDLAPKRRTMELRSWLSTLRSRPAQPRTWDSGDQRRAGSEVSA